MSPGRVQRDDESRQALDGRAVRPVVEWILGRPYRPTLVAVACSPLPLLGPFVTTAVLALATAHAGVRFGLVTAALGSAVLTALVAITGGDIVLLAGGGVFSMLVGAGLGALLRWARGMSLAFQSLLLLSFVLAAGVSLFGPDAQTMFGPMLEEIIAIVAQDASSEQADAIRELAPVMLGVLSAGVFVQLMLALVVGYWALSYVREEVAFGESFRALKLGRVLGIFGMVWVTLGLFVPFGVVQNLTPLALMGFLFQGLAVMHAWAYAKQWHPGLIAPVYVLFVPPMTGVTVMGLSAVGLLDNVFDLRAPLKGAT